MSHRQICCVVRVHAAQFHTFSTPPSSSPSYAHREYARFVSGLSFPECLQGPSELSYNTLFISPGLRFPEGEVYVSAYRVSLAIIEAGVTTGHLRIVSPTMSGGITFIVDRDLRVLAACVNYVPRLVANDAVRWLSLLEGNVRTLAESLLAGAVHRYMFATEVDIDSAVTRAGSAALKNTATGFLPNGHPLPPPMGPAHSTVPAYYSTNVNPQVRSRRPLLQRKVCPRLVK